MQTITTNASAILAGQQRSTRFQYRHSVAGAAKDVGIPDTWIWSWLLAKRLKSQKWLRKVWVKLNDVQTLFEDLKAVKDAFYATGEPLTRPEAIYEVLDRWPRFPAQMYLDNVPKKPCATVTPIRNKKEIA